jgi:hypothetical protein
LALVTELGYSHFEAGSAAVADVGWWNLSAHLSYGLGGRRLRPFVEGGAGLYMPRNGSAEPGFDLGLGLRSELGPAGSFELGVVYRHILTPGSDARFLTPHLRIVRRF